MLAPGMDGWQAAPVSAQERSREPVSWSVGLLTVLPHDIYDGSLRLSAGQERYGAQYEERPETTLGVYGGVNLDSERFGSLTLHGFVAPGRSVGTYGGIAASETHERRLLSVGLDVGWRPRVVAGPIEVRVPFGPSLFWQRLDLGAGHRDILGAPESVEAPRVDWSSREWFSIGGYGGLLVTVDVLSHVSLYARGDGRFLYFGKNQWSSSEENDIRRSTGNAVSIRYDDPIVLLTAFQIGLEWSPTL